MQTVKLLPIYSTTPQGWGLMFKVDLDLRKTCSTTTFRAKRTLDRAKRALDASKLGARVASLCVISIA